MEEGISLSTIIAAIINFIVLFFVLKHFTFEKFKNEIVKAEIIIDKTSDTILTTGFSIPEQLIR